MAIEKILSEMQIIYGFHQTPFGMCCIALMHERICHLSFVDSKDEGLVVNQLQREWPEVPLFKTDAETKSVVDTIFARKAEKKIPNFVLRGTEFQQLVWQKLCEIPAGQTRSYEEIAQMISKPTAIRAVANAIAQNRIAYLIPCHRVISKSGDIHKYRWGAERKRAILIQEGCFND